MTGFPHFFETQELKRNLKTTIKISKTKGIEMDEGILILTFFHNFKPSHELILKGNSVKKDKLKRKKGYGNHQT